MLGHFITNNNWMTANSNKKKVYMLNFCLQHLVFVDNSISDDHDLKELFERRHFSYGHMNLIHDSLVLEQNSLVLGHDSLVLEQNSLVLEQNSWVLERNSWMKMKNS